MTSHIPSAVTTLSVTIIFICFTIMTRFEFSRYDARVIINFLNELQLAPAEIHAHMVKVIGVEDSPSIQTVRKWVREFKEGRSDCHDVKRPGRPAAD